MLENGLMKGFKLFDEPASNVATAATLTSDEALPTATDSPRLNLAGDRSRSRSNRGHAVVLEGQSTTTPLASFLDRRANKLCELQFWTWIIAPMLVWVPFASMNLLLFTGVAVESLHAWPRTLILNPFCAASVGGAVGMVAYKRGLLSPSASATFQCVLGLYFHSTLCWYTGGLTTMAAAGPPQYIQVRLSLFIDTRACRIHELLAALRRRRLQSR